MRWHVAWLGAGCVLVGPSAGCGGGDASSGMEAACAPDPLSLDARPAATAALRGSVRVRDERDTSLSNGERLNISRGRVTASFGRIPNPGSATAAAGLDLGSGCVGLTSRPLTSESTAVSVGRLSVQNSMAGPFEVPGLGEGRYAFVGPPILPAPGQPALRLEAEPGSFPGFEATLDGVAPLRLEAPVPGQTGPLSLSAWTVRWDAPTTEDGAIYLELAPRAAPGGIPSGGQVVCRVRDDGCHTVPASAVVFLRSSPASEFSVILRRERVHVVAVDDAEVLLEASSSWRFDLEAVDP